MYQYTCTLSKVALKIRVIFPKKELKSNKYYPSSTRLNHQYNR
jgi:hypothetical protein